MTSRTLKLAFPENGKYHSGRSSVTGGDKLPRNKAIAKNKHVTKAHSYPNAKFLHPIGKITYPKSTNLETTIAQKT